MYHQELRPLAVRFDRDTGPFLNADDYARERWGADHDPQHDYEAAREVARQREQLLHERRSFTTETVFSHPSKQQLIDTANQLGYDVFLEIVVVPVETSIERVAHRHAAGGHDVPEDKIRQRAQRADLLLAQAISTAYQARIWDNAADGAHHTRRARFERGMLAVRRRIPDWFPPHLTDAIRTAPRLARPGYGHQV